MPQESAAYEREEKISCQIKGAQTCSPSGEGCNSILASLIATLRLGKVLRSIAKGRRLAKVRE